MRSSLLPLLLFFLCIFSSCEKETVLSVDQTSLSYTDAGGSQTVSLTANKPWSVKCDQSWCKVSPSSGEEAASSKISISCDANTTYDARNCTVTFTCAELTKTVSVSQATNNGLLVSQTSYELTKAAQQLNIQVQANVKFSVEVDAGCKDWVTYNSTKGLSNSTVVLDIAENKTYDSREGKVTIKENGGSLSSTITIKQSQLDGLFITTPEYNLSNEKHTLTVEVSTNVEFDVTPEADWVKYVQTKGLSSKQIILEVAENDTYDQRETTVSVNQKNGDLSGTIKIKQDEKYDILVTQSEYTLSNEAQTIDVEVKYNVGFDVVIPDECKDWVSIVGTKGLSSRTYTFSIAKNESYVDREGSITFKQNKGELGTTIKILQARTGYLKVLPTIDTVSFRKDSTSFSIITNLSYSLSVPFDADWLSVASPKKEETINGLTSYTYRVDVQENGGTTPRKAELLIMTEGGSCSSSFIVVQRPDPIICFADPLTKDICVSNWDLNKDGELSEGEAAKVTSIVNCFTEQDICSFDEFRYFINVKDVSAYGFRLCTNLSSIVLPNSIDQIGNYAFESCTHLSNVTLSRGLSHIGVSAFRKCTRLKTISVPDGVDTIEKYAFNDCGSLESIDLPNSICSLGEGVFWGCKNLVSIRIPNELTRIEKRMFSGCVALSEVSFSECIVDIGDHAFFDCNSLTSLTIPKTIKNIGYASFMYCTGLLAITILAENPPTLVGEEYDGLTFDHTNECPIFVPASSIEAYQTASVWDVYAGRIKAIPE